MNVLFPVTTAVMTMLVAQVESITEVGLNEVVSDGVRRTEAWEYEAAIHGNRILYVYSSESAPTLRKWSLWDINMYSCFGRCRRRTTATVKPEEADCQRSRPDCLQRRQSHRGPQATGLLLGRKELIASALQMLDMDDHPQL